MSQLAACYLRVSTEDQTEFSPDAQLRAVRAWAEKNGYVVPDHLVFKDEGISGRSAAKRPGFLAMIQAARSKDRLFDSILVHKFDRFARSREDSIVYKSLLQREGVTVVSVTETIDDGGSGMAMLMEAITEAYAEFYSVNLGREVKKGMTERARRGLLQATPSFGYRAEAGRLVPVEEEAAFVRQIFERFVAGDGLTRIAISISDQGARTHRGNVFDNRGVEYIIRNPVYVGKLRWNPEGRTRRNFRAPSLIVSPSDHDPLVSQELWDKANRLLDEQKVRMPYKAKPSYALKDWMSGVVRCAACGATMVRQSDRYFICGNYIRGRCRLRQMVRSEELRGAIMDRLRQDAATGDVDFSVVRASAPDARRSALQQELAAVQRKIQRAREAYLAGAEELSGYMQIKAALESDLRRLSEALSACSEDRQQLQGKLLSDLRRALSTLEAPDASLERKNQAIRSILERCAWDRAAHTLSITYRVIL